MEYSDTRTDDDSEIVDGLATGGGASTRALCKGAWRLGMRQTLCVQCKEHFIGIIHTLAKTSLSLSLPLSLSRMVNTLAIWGVLPQSEELPEWLLFGRVTAHWVRSEHRRMRVCIKHNHYMRRGASRRAGGQEAPSHRLLCRCQRRLCRRRVRCLKVRSSQQSVHSACVCHGGDSFVALRQIIGREDIIINFACLPKYARTQRKCVGTTRSLSLCLWQRTCAGCVQLLRAFVI